MAAIDRVFVQYYIIKRGSTTPGGAVTRRPRCLINVFFFNNVQLNDGNVAGNNIAVSIWSDTANETYSQRFPPPDNAVWTTVDGDAF